MIVSIFRHGEAADAANDRQRVLTPRGEREVASAATLFTSACESADISLPTVLLHSPWERTTQTAVLLNAISAKLRLAPCDALYPGGEVAAVEEHVEHLLSANEQHIVLVSHQPLVSYLLSHFLPDASRVPPMSPGSWVTFSLDVAGANCGRLEFWAMPPAYEVQR